MSLRLRLVLVSIAGIALLGTAIMVIAYASVGRAGNERSDALLRRQAADIAAGVTETPRDMRGRDAYMDDEPRIREGDFWRDRHHESRDDDGPPLPDRIRRAELIGRLVTPRGAVISQSAAAAELDDWPRPSARSERGELWRMRTMNGTRYRLLEVRTNLGNVAQVARPRDEIEAALTQLRRVLIGVAAIAIFGSALLSWWATGAALRPIRRMTQAADRIRETGDLATRVQVEHGDPAITGLGDSLNAMLDSLQESHVAQRTFVADASHELKTPLTSLRGNADFIRERTTGDAASTEAVEAIERDIDRLTQLAASLTTLATLDAAPALHVHDVDVAAIVHEETERARRAFRDHVFHISAASTGDEGLTFVRSCDPELVRRIISNLLHNAGTHTPTGTRVVVTLAEADDAWSITVHDTGPGLSAADAELAFQRFHRGASTASGGGSGLGLSIVRAAAEMMGGAATISNEPGGLVVTVNIPESHPNSQ
jgi:signal transduction histidine kinase